MSIITYVPNENKIVHETKVDFSKRVVPETIQLVQYDSGIPIIAVSLYLNGQVYSILDDIALAMKVRWSKTGQPFVHKDILGCNAARTIAYVGIDSEMTDIYGEYNPVLELVETVNNIDKRMGSSSFPVIVNRNPITKEMEA